jgi:hypothetical protein
VREFAPDSLTGATTVAKSPRPVVLAGVGDFLQPRLPEWDHLLMNQDDPEKRIAELERQLAEEKRTDHGYGGSLHPP